MLPLFMQRLFMQRQQTRPTHDSMAGTGICNGQNQGGGEGVKSNVFFDCNKGYLITQVLKLFQYMIG